MFGQPAFFEGRPAYAGGPKDLAWFRPDGREIGDQDWFSPASTRSACTCRATASAHASRRGERIIDDSFLLLLHAGADDTTFMLPGEPWATSWCVLLDTAADRPALDEQPAAAGQPLAMTGRSAQLLRTG